MFEKILIANRGEIAVRVAKTAKKLGVQTVAIYSEVDANALHVEMCDESVCVGGAAPADSYLNVERIIAAAKATGSEAIHPGYGFLSENAAFARRCESEGIKFIGPSSSTIESMGLKSAAKAIVEKAGVPLLPGYHGDDQSDSVLVSEATRIGYPLLIKASAGGGGKGMRIVMKAEDFDSALAGARREAANSFGNDHVLIERYIQAPRHVEVQIFADSQGDCVYLFERDCSLQRRYQKVIEEAPAPGLSEEVRRHLGEVAVSVAQAVSYEGAGTVEFIMDEQQNFYFMEMNTRLQVEHPVTEMIVGEDLVEWQLRVASGESLPKTQEAITSHGHAFEARIYAEDPHKDFLPAAGQITYLSTPDPDGKRIRIETGVRVGDEVGVYYDPMIAKVVCWGESRDLALQALRDALRQYHLAGIQTNTNFLIRLASVTNFTDADRQPSGLTTGLIAQFKDELTSSSPDVEKAAIVMSVAYDLNHQAASTQRAESDRYSPWAMKDGWRLNAPPSRRYTYSVNETEYRVVTTDESGQITVSFEDAEITLDTVSLQGNNVTASLDHQKQQATVHQDGLITTVFYNGHTVRLSAVSNSSSVEEESENALVAPLPGYVRQVLVAKGDVVTKDQPLIIVEAMKMEHTILSPKDGLVDDVFYKAGDQVLEGAELLAIEEQKG
ncbi:MAG: acetyl/propionyl/methylcrotonyl-CoA carboxylase subunit alpha [Betaproteobacteria bacterium]